MDAGFLDVTLRDTAADARFRVPTGLDVERGRVRWLVSDGQRFTEPFFEDTVRRLRRQAGPRGPAETPLDAWSGPCDPPAAVTVIFHISRCGSTLLSQLLAALPDHLVVSEAPVIDDALRSQRDNEGIGSEQREAWLRRAAQAFFRSQTSAPSRLVLKLDCWHIFEIDLIRRAFPDAPLLFVYRDPLEVLVSLMERPSVTLVGGTVSPREMGVSPETYDSLSREAFAAAVIGAFFREAAAHRPHLVPVAYTSLPEFVWTSFPGLAPAPHDIARLEAVARAHAKEPRASFAPDGERKRASADDALKAACAAWAEPAYADWLAVL